MSRKQASSDVFQAVADPTRRAILDILSSGDQSVGDIANRFDVSLSAVSQHMRVLRDAGLVSVHKHGRERIYKLAAGPIQDLHVWSSRYAAFWSESIADLTGTLNRMQLEESNGHED